MNEFHVGAEFSSFEDVKIMMEWKCIKTPTFFILTIPNGTIAIQLMVWLTFRARIYITYLKKNGVQMIEFLVVIETVVSSNFRRTIVQKYVGNFTFSAEPLKIFVLLLRVSFYQVKSNN